MNMEFEKAKGVHIYSKLFFAYECIYFINMYININIK